MKCDKCNELMMKYFDKNILDSENDLLMSHLKECSSCNEEFNQISEVLENVANIDIEISNEFEENVIAKIKEMNIEAFDRKVVVDKIKKYIMTVGLITSFTIISYIYLIKLIINTSVIFSAINTLVEVIQSLIKSFYCVYFSITLNLANEYYYFLILLIALSYAVKEIVKILPDSNYGGAK